MKRVNILWFLLNSLFLIVFNLMFFMLGEAENSNTSVWICYGFIHFAYILLLITPFLIRKSSVEYIYRRPPFFVTSTYFVVELIIGITLILIAPETTKVTLIIQIVVVALFLAWLLAHLIVNEHTANKAEIRKTELQFIKESSAKLQLILQQITDHETSKKVERLYDFIRSSPTRSNAEVESIEQQVINEITQMEGVAKENNMKQMATDVDNVYRLVEERYNKLKLLN